MDFEESLGLPRTQLVSFDGSVRDAVARLEASRAWSTRSRTTVYHACAAAPNDTFFGHCGGSARRRASDVLPAWDRTRGAGQVIAVVDTGVDLTHPDLGGNLWTGPGGIHGHDFVDNDTDPDDFNLHGTHVAGTAAAVADNALGVAGVAPEAQIMAVRVLDGDGGGSKLGDRERDPVRGRGRRGRDQPEPRRSRRRRRPGDERRDRAGRDKGCGGGRRGRQRWRRRRGDNNDAAPTTPCNLPNANLICVAAVTKTGARSDFSNFGSASVDLGAPGGDGSGNPDDDILSAKPAWAAALHRELRDRLGGWTASRTWELDWGSRDTGIGGPAGSATDSPGGDYQDEHRLACSRRPPRSTSADSAAAASTSS